LKVYGLTDTGRMRTNKQNEDTIFYTADPIGALPNVLVVSDGMGGHKAGEVASRNAVEFFCGYVRSKARAPEETLDLLVSAVGYANEQVYQMSMGDRALYGMGATFSACVADGGKLYIAHVGDSRVYMTAGGALSQITIDHSYVNELVRAGIITEKAARSHPRKNELTRVLGFEPGVKIDGFVTDAAGAGYLLLCSDGLTNMLTNEEIFAIINGAGSVEEKTRRLIGAANDCGGRDNISAILADLRR